MFRSFAFLVTRCLTVTIVAGGPAVADIVHHWALDETSGLTTTDRTCNSTGDLVNFENLDDGQWVDGVHHGALDLGADGFVDNFVAVDLEAIDASVTSGFTVCMWVNPGEQILTTGEYQLLRTPGDAVGFTIMNFDGEARHDRVLLFWDGDINNLHVGTTTLEPGDWYHVAITSAGIGGEKLYYIDGEPDDQTLFLPSRGGTEGVHDGFRGGWSAGLGALGALENGTRSHDSIIDDVRIYDTALSAEELQDVMDDTPAPGPRIVDISPETGNVSHEADDGIQFDVEAVADGAIIAVDDIRLFLNGDDVSGELTVGGSPTNREVEYLGLDEESAYSARIEVSDSNGSLACAELSFGTLTEVVDGLVHHWSMDQTTGLVALDTGSARNGALVGFENDDDAQWVRGVCDTGLDLGADGTINNYVEANIAALSASETGGFTVAMWLNPGEQILTPGEYQLLSTPNDLVGFTLMNFTGEERHDRVLLFWDGVLPDLHVGTTTLEPGNWYHVAITSTGSGGDKLYYINGELEEQTLFLPSRGGVEGFHPGFRDGWPEGIARIGAIGAGARTHDSILDDVRIYDRALEEDEITEIMQECDPVICEPLVLENVSPQDGGSFHDAASGIGFDVSTPNGEDGFTLTPENITLVLNGVDVSGDLRVAGTPVAREIEYEGLEADTLYTAEISVTDGCAVAQRTISFDTFARCDTDADDLRHHWKLDHTNGLTAVDCVGSAHGSLAGFDDNDDRQWVDGVEEGGLDLGADDTTDNYFEMTLPQMDAAETGGFTVAMWINPGEQILTPGEYQLLRAPNDAVGFTIMNDSRELVHDRVLLFWDGDLANLHVGTTTLEPGTWYHVAITSGGVGREKRYYVNGELEDQTLFVPSLGGIEGVHDAFRDGWTSGAARVGAVPGLVGRFHDSILDDIRIYETALEEDRVAEIAGEPPPVQGPLFHRGDPNDDGFMQLSDAIYVLNFLFLGGPPPTCADSGDADDNGRLELTDGVFILSFLFSGGDAPPDPGLPEPDSCGVDPAEPADELGCELYSGCPG